MTTLELTDSEASTLRWLLIQDKPYAEGRIQTSDGNRRQTALAILDDIESMLEKLKNG